MADCLDHVAIDGPLPSIDSKEVRYLCRQCQKCWKRRTAEVKLFVCSSCKITSYCSTKCQKEDWQFHKAACRANREVRNKMAAADEFLQMFRLASGEDLDWPLISTVNQEVGEFLKRFRPMICLAGYRCLAIKRGNPDAWKEYVFQLRIERISNPPKDSRPWERYKVVSGEPASIAGLLKDPNDSFEGLMKQFETYHQENVRVGCVGTITTFIVCDSAGQDMRCVSWGGFGEDAWEDTPPGHDWLEIFKEVERLSGRST